MRRYERFQIKCPRCQEPMLIRRVEIEPPMPEQYILLKKVSLLATYKCERCGMYRIARIYADAGHLLVHVDSYYSLSTSNTNASVK